MREYNFLYANATNCDISDFDKEIYASLRDKGTLPEELAGLFTARLVPPEFGNPDGSPRYIIEMA